MAPLFVKSVAIFLFLFFEQSYSEGLTCLDEDGKPVDWYIAYKLDRDEGSTQDLLSKGLAYVYMSSDSNDGWKVSPKSIGDGDTAVGRLYYSLYKNYKEDSSNLIYINYNDEHPDGKTSFTKGHTKGLTAFNQDGGFWMIHSVPKFFPLITEGKYYYNLPQAVYSQAFMCISLSTSEANSVGELLTYDTPYIYEAMAGDSIADSTPQLTAVVNNKAKPKSPWYLSRTLTSTPNGVKFQAFGKAKDFEADLYHELVAPTLMTDLLTMTWMQGGKLCPSNCTAPYSVKNVEAVDIKEFPSEQNHGVGHCKMAVGEKSDWACVGDINRMYSQFKRPGGTACFEDAKVATAFRSMVKTTEGCDSPFTPPPHKYKYKYHHYHHYWRYHVKKPTPPNSILSVNSV